MDPLSITAGVIAVVGAAGKVGVDSRNSQELRKASDAVHALINEVSTLQAVLQQIDSAVRQQRDRMPQESGDCLCGIL